MFGTNRNNAVQLVSIQGLLDERTLVGTYRFSSH